ncbi:polysaccharide biosynthesis tyrosine autokinase [Ornithinimicrobium flavum]|uniref:polysaccharide biosynthesis tyrosine autokinase n=1 Tax=Ornithinimicrobium flavum TaxID=1288636 RepID=UPI00106F0AD0|nr:polysaccharide biosynthesis tyrosine autokinase [Ornithinimicrobium flavum]
MTISDFLSALQQRWRIIVATLLIVVSTTAIVTMQTPLVYQSSTRVYLLASGEGGSGNAYNMPGSEKETLVQVASSPVVLDAVREQLGLPAGTPIDVSASTSGDTNLMDVTARSDTPQGAQQIATAVPQELAAVARNFAPSLAISGQTVEAQVIAPAGTPGSPVEPDIVTNLLLGALAGLLLGIAFAVLRHNVDNRVRTQRDIASLSDRPLLASIPVTDKSEAGHELYVESDPFGAQAEAVRQLRTNMLFVDVTTGGHSFLLTSSLPGEGKTTTTVNLGLSLADSGLKVLVIDADLRHPTVAKTLGLESAVGLTTVLVGAAEPDDVIQQWAGTNLHILAAGEVPPNPSELLGSGAMRTLFHQLTEQFDFILVDTPPVLPVTDALVVSRLTSGSIMVVASGTTRKRHLAEAMRVLGTADVELGGFVLTKAPAAPTAYYYYGGGTQTSEYGETRASRNGTGRDSGGDGGGRRRRGRSRGNTVTRARRTKRVEKQFPNATRAAEERKTRNETRAAWQPAVVAPAADEQVDPGSDEQATTASRRGS